MSRLPRIIVPSFPHHVTERGNRRQRVFMEDDDMRFLEIPRSRRAGLTAWRHGPYCLIRRTPRPGKRGRLLPIRMTRKN